MIDVNRSLHLIYTLYVCMSVCMYACMHVCMYVCICLSADPSTHPSIFTYPYLYQFIYLDGSIHLCSLSINHRSFHGSNDGAACRNQGQAAVVCNGPSLQLALAKLGNMGNESKCSQMIRSWRSKTCRNHQIYQHQKGNGNLLLWGDVWKNHAPPECWLSGKPLQLMKPSPLKSKKKMFRQTNF